MRIAIAVLLASLASAQLATAGGTGWHIVGQGEASGRFTVAASSATVARPHALRMTITAKPNINTDAGYALQCRTGSRHAEKRVEFTARTPIARQIPLPFKLPNQCIVVANGTLPEKTAMTVTIYAR
jgi:hypothetical protein